MDIKERLKATVLYGDLEAESLLMKLVDAFSEDQLTKFLEENDLMDYLIPGDDE